MALTAHDLLHDADLFRRCYPNWPLASPPAPEPAPAEVTITPGDEAHCVSCGHLPGCSCPEDCSYEEDGR